MKQVKVNRRNALITLGGFSTVALTGSVATAHPVERTAVPTGTDVEGPFFRDNAPLRTQLSSGEEDEQLLLTGVVSGLSPDGRVDGLESARVNIWHASPNGIYDLQNELRYHGHSFTGSNGLYEFLTCIPSAYRDGGLERPAHIHFKVSAPGFIPITTQMYFAGDKRLEEDPFVQENDGLRRAVMLQRLARGKFSARFDIVLRALA